MKKKVTDEGGLQHKTINNKTCSQKKKVSVSVTINPPNTGSNNKKSVVSQYLQYLYMLENHCIIPCFS